MRKLEARVQVICFPIVVEKKDRESESAKRGEIPRELIKGEQIVTEMEQLRNTERMTATDL